MIDNKPKHIKSTWIDEVTLEWLQEPDAPRVMIHKGGTRSGKTYNLCIAWVQLLLERKARLSIVRKTNPSLKRSVWRDMREVLERMEVYSEDSHNKTEQEFILPGGSVIDYFPADDEQKLRGPGRDYLWCNEANELNYPQYKQLLMRTGRKVTLDFNPSMRPDHWIFDRYDGSEDSIWYTSTISDNPFATEEQRREIEAMRDQDPWWYKVYGQGKQARPSHVIYPHVQKLTEWEHQSSVLGLDFGYNHPMTLVRVATKDREGGAPFLDIWALFYATHHTTQELIEKLPQLGVDRSDRIICDREPDRIKALTQAGYNAVAASKGPGSVSSGIDAVKRYVLRVGGPEGEQARSELRNYRWKIDPSTEDPLDDPVKAQDHVPDAVRYATVDGYTTESAFFAA